MKNIQTEKKATMTKSVTNSLGKAQDSLEIATKELRAAQAGYEKALERLQLAQEGHEQATATLVAEVATIRTNTKVTPLTLR